VVSEPDRAAVVVMACKFAAEEWASGDVVMAQRLCSVVWENCEKVGYQFVDDEVDR
jgi:hypothetical protein